MLSNINMLRGKDGGVILHLLGLAVYTEGEKSMQACSFTHCSHADSNCSLIGFCHVLLRLMDNETEQDLLQDPCGSSRISSISLWVDTANTHPNCCRMAPGSAKDSRVSISGLYFHHL